MQEIILSIDIGYVKPVFVLSYYNDNCFDKILIFNNFKFKYYTDSIKYLKYFFSLKPTKVLIEKQFIYSRNVSLMTFIHGFYVACNIPVIIVDPISKIRPDKTKSTRTIRKQFSVNIINKILQTQNYDYNFKLKDNDICDALNIVLYNKFNDKDYIEKYNIPINDIMFVSLKLK